MGKKKKFLGPDLSYSIIFSYFCCQIAKREMGLRLFLKYLVSSVLSMAAVRLANMADAALVGNIVGAEGLAGVTLCQPVMQVLFSLYTLLILSSSVLMGMAIGKGDKERATRLLAFGMKAGLAIGIMVCAAGYLFFDELSQLLCQSDSLRPYADAYLRVILVGAIPQMAMYGLNQFVAVDGSPHVVSRIAVGGNILNVCLDVVFMKYLGWGIAGAALATLTMYVVCTLLLLRHRFTGTYGIVRALTRSSGVSALKGEVTRFGLPLFLSAALLTVQFYSNNTVATTFLGNDGMVVLAVCMQLYDFSLIILTGTMTTAQTLGARVRGEDNHAGLWQMYRFIYTFLLSAASVYAVSIALLSSRIAWLLGADSTQQQDMAARALPAFAVYLVLMPMVYLLLPAYQFYERKALAYVHSVGVTLVPAIGFGVCVMLDADYCWWGFVIGELAVIAALLVMTEVVRRKERSLVPLLLIKK